MKQFWDERYQEPEYIYGKAPNAFLAEQLPQLGAGKALFPAEGEGRNSAYAASLGWRVRAFDYSRAAKAKAEQLYGELGVNVDYEVSAAEAFDFGESQYDLIGLLYVHLPPEVRATFHQTCMQALKPGGYILLEAFDLKQLPLSSGGPKKLDMLYSLQTIEQDFAGLVPHVLAQEKTLLSEGAYHKGEAEVVRLLAQKPA